MREELQLEDIILGVQDEATFDRFYPLRDIGGKMFLKDLLTKPQHTIGAF